MGAEFLHAEPALLLSRQSVLSVFSTDGFEEVGGTLTAEPCTGCGSSRGYVDAYGGTGPGARGEVAARIATGQSLPRSFASPTLWRDRAQERLPGGACVVQPCSVSPVGSTLEAYGYFYDEPVAGYSLLPSMQEPCPIKSSIRSKSSGERP